MRRMAAAIVLLCALVPNAAGQTPQAKTSPGRVVTTTRLVTLFSDLETQWLNALQQKDQAALDRLLGDDFEVWAADSPGVPLPREEWQKQALARPLTSFQVSQMAVRGISDEAAIASFILDRKYEANGRTQEQNDFVVDVWQNQDGTWKCTDLYISSRSGTEKRAPSRDAKPTGKQ